MWNCWIIWWFYFKLLWGNSILFSIVEVPIFIATNTAIIPFFPHPTPTLAISYLLVTVILTDVKWYFTTVLIDISLMIDNVEHLFITWPSIGLLCAHTQSCSALRSPMDPSGSSALGIFQARILGWGAISYSRGSSGPRDQTHFSCISCIGR